LILAIIGGVGSGKSVSGVKFMMDRKHPLFTNFKIRNKEHIKRLKYAMLFKEIVTEVTARGKEIKKFVLNWDFWKEQIKNSNGFDIVIDEIHNIFNARRSMSKENILLQQWVAQIRKILAGDEKCHFVCISQKLERIDVSLRDLIGGIVFCQKTSLPDVLIETVVYKNKKRVVQMLPKTFIVQFVFKGTYSVENFHSFLMGGKT